MEPSLTVLVVMGLYPLVVLVLKAARAEMISRRITIMVRALRLTRLSLNIYNELRNFLNCVKGNFFSFYIESRWTKRS